MDSRKLAWILAAMLAFAAAPAVADEPAPGVAWESLDAAQQRALKERAQEMLTSGRIGQRPESVMVGA